MTKSLYCFIALLFLCGTALAQGVDTIHKDTSKHVIVLDAKPIDKNYKPFILVNGTVYKGKLNKINPKDILQVAVLKSPEAVNLYGPQGVNGAILVSTKSYQRINAGKNNDTVKSAFSDGAIYIIDGILSDKKLEGVNPHDVLSIDIIRKDKAYEYSENDVRGGVVVVVTKAFAVISYQKKLSAFSKKYKNYIETHQNNDKELVYVLNGVPLEKKNNDEIIRTLYKISIENIKTVNYPNNFIERMKSGATIFITTKK
jgi:hypothetical protein